MIRDISEFEPSIEFIRGRDNFMADALSRLGWNTQLPQEENPSLVAAMESIKPEEQFFSHELDIDRKEFRAKQKEDPILKPYLSVHKNETGLAILEGQGQVLVPAPFVPTILSLAHDATAYQGPKTMLARIEAHYWWPKVEKSRNRELR